MFKQSQSVTDEATRVVVLGSGYAGIHAALQLVKRRHRDENIEVVLISNTDHLLYVTMLYEVVAGNLAPSSVRQSVRTTLSEPGTRFVQGKVTEVNFDQQIISYVPADTCLEVSDKKRDIHYDYLISSIGSETNYLDTPGAEEFSHPVKTLSDATQLKNKLIRRFEQAELLEDKEEQKNLLSVVIVGGGSTGVTLGAKIADLFNNELGTSFPELISLARVTILESHGQLLDNLGSWFSQRAAEALESKGCVDVKTNQRAVAVSGAGVTTRDGFIPSKCVIWTAGVRAREFGVVSEELVDVDELSRRIYVTEELCIPGYKNVFVAGDQSWVKRPEHGPYPMRAQFAVRQGQQAAKNVLHNLRGSDLETFSWVDKGLVVSIGEGHTLAEVAGFRFTGWLATAAYKTIYLLSTVGVRAKMRAILEWGMNLFLPRDVSEL